ncbi:hypothetical protein AX769_08285 [Frondihabitans sp. PAMC 28766]|uniref:hypothetical protein n=1 Tax=Frondihabitans sp. PAMC 28766 TaxID=1795630 RepID=UPI00078D2392|nr:hypothetical protein [Frondihabitans sp. PAMC 28766]AMM20165.1 hypothetical protein AX769_08285 [Frondihabitans sp. PAMC 28766]
MTDDRDLSRQLTALIRNTPGVVEVYSTVPLLQKAVHGVVSALTNKDDALVKVAHDGPITTVAVHVAVHEALPGPDTLRTLTSAIRTHMVDLGLQPLIEVKVVRFGDDPPRGEDDTPAEGEPEGPLAEVG